MPSFASTLYEVSGSGVGSGVGAAVGDDVGMFVSPAFVGNGVGDVVGVRVGLAVGVFVGALVGALVGAVEMVPQTLSDCCDGACFSNWTPSTHCVKIWQCLLVLCVGGESSNCTV
jgi:hypothetical protein